MWIFERDRGRPKMRYNGLSKTGFERGVGCQSHPKPSSMEEVKNDDPTRVGKDTAEEEEEEKDVITFMRKIRKKKKREREGAE